MRDLMSRLLRRDNDHRMLILELCLICLIHVRLRRLPVSLVARIVCILILCIARLVRHLRCLTRACRALSRPGRSFHFLSRSE